MDVSEMLLPWHPASLWEGVAVLEYDGTEKGSRWDRVWSLATLFHIRGENNIKAFEKALVIVVGKDWQAETNRILGR